MARTDQEVVDQTNEVARIIYASRGYGAVPKGTEFHTETVNRHPYERASWEAACAIQILLTQTDPEEALQNLEEDAESRGEVVND